MAKFQQMIIQEVLPITREIRQFNLRDAVPSFIMLCESPAEVVQQLEVLQFAVAIMIVGDSLSGSHPIGTPGMIEIALRGVFGGICWEGEQGLEIVQVSDVHKGIGWEVYQLAIRHFYAVVLDKHFKSLLLTSH